MKMAPTRHNEDNETLIYNTIHELIKIWRKGSGQANLSIDINDGLCDLNLSFKFERQFNGLATCTNQIPVINPSFGQKKNRNRRRKSPSQRERDRKRAEYRLQKIKKTKIILPFSGQLLPLNEINIIEDVVDPCDHTVEVEDSPKSVVNTPEVPMKNSCMNDKLYTDVNSVKKKLFSANDLPVTSSSHEVQPQKVQHYPLNYQKREEAVWSKLFR